MAIDELDYNGLSVDAEGVTDEPGTSKLAIAAFLMLIVSSLAPIEWRLTFVSGFAVLLALVVLFFNKANDISSISRYLAIFTAFAGTMLTVWGTVVHQADVTRQKVKAIEVAAEYIQALADGDKLKAIQMVGLEPVVTYGMENEVDKMSKTQQEVRNYLDNYDINKVMERGDKAKWVQRGPVSSYVHNGEHVYDVPFYDETVNNPKPYVVIVHMLPPNKFMPEPQWQWMVNQLVIRDQ